MPPPSGSSARPAPSRRSSSRNKRSDILIAATEDFARHGYEHSKWADVAAAVGVGSTALYHYFESKLHCLYEIMADALEADLADFQQRTAPSSDFAASLVAALGRIFGLTEHEILRNRVLVAERSLVAVHRTSPREEAARQRAREAMRDLEFAWATFLVRGMEQGAIPEADARLLTRAMLGLHNSVWHWYRPGGSLDLAVVKEFYIRRCLDVAGLQHPTDVD